MVIFNKTDEFKIYLETLKEFASEGLRTFVFGSRVIEEKEYTDWHQIYIYTQLNKVENKEIILNKLIMELENNLLFRGIAAIEDKLQEGVKETIELMLNANINFWVLTGDKKVSLFYIK
jgi:phospholipid-translocating ATPase